VKIAALFALAPTVLAVLGGQGTLLEPLNTDFSKLASAKSLHAEYTLLIGSDSQGKYDLWMSKDNMFKLTSPHGFVLSDGQSLYTYNKDTNQYSKAPLDAHAISAFEHRPEVFAWAPFFDKMPATNIEFVALGATRTFKGNPIQEVVVKLKNNSGTAMVFIDQTLGIARGMRLQTDKTYLAQADLLTISDQADSADKYAFAAPDGALEMPAADAATTYAQVQDLMTNNCMPCHNSSNQRGGFDLSSYAGVAQTVQPGKSGDSLLIKALRGNGADLMPRGRSPLPDSNIQLISKWIDAGAKNE
jgi:hypothetical protein